jgi:thaumarchaeosortase
MRLALLVRVRNNANKLIPLLPVLGFSVASLLLFLFHPESFELMWKGRTFQLFFVWLILLELILGWESLQNNKVDKVFSRRSIVVIIAFLLPAVYVAASSYFGLNAVIADSARQSGIYWWMEMPIAVEYLVFAGLFCLLSVAIYGAKGLKNYSIPILFSTLMGTVFVIDNVYPFDQFTPFQFLVPTTTTLAANTLNFMGYHTTLDLSRGNLPQLTVTDTSNPLNTVAFGIAWPCAGIESLLIFTVTILLFLKRMPIAWRARIGYLAFGVVVTYLINILRIVSIFVYALNGGDIDLFHSTYGPLYPIAWIASYPLIIIGSQSLWRKLTNQKRESSLVKVEEIGIHANS